MRVKTHFRRIGFSFALVVAATLVNFAGPAAQESTQAEPTIEPQWIVDRHFPLIIVASKGFWSGKWTPKKVVGYFTEKCDDQPAEEETACRKPGEMVRWVVWDADSDKFIREDFEITFKTDDPTDPDDPPQAKCRQSKNGALACKVNSKATKGYYGYTVTMSGGSRDPRIYVNP